MTNRTGSGIIRRILRISFLFQVCIVAASWVFTNSFLCSIITLSATLIAQLGYLAMIRSLDRYLRQRRGLIAFFLVFLLKMGLIVFCFILASRISEQAVLFYLLGVSVVVMATLIEAGIQLLRSLPHGRTQTGHR